MLATIVIALIILVPLGWWAFRPVATFAAGTESSAPPSIEGSSAAIDATTSFDISAFNVTLWRTAEPSAPREATPPPPVPETLRVELLGVSIVNDLFTAWVFDPAEDEIRRVQAGDRFGRFEVQDVTARSVVLHDGSRAHTLVLMEPPPSP